MTEETNNPVGGDEPLKPTHSLPRYSEPTPETHRKLSREEEAELALKNTAFTPGVAVAAHRCSSSSPFFSFPRSSLRWSFGHRDAEGRLGTFDIYNAYPAWEKIRAVRSPKDIWRLLPRAAELKAAEEDIRKRVGRLGVAAAARPIRSHGKARRRQRTSLSRPDGWLFYRPDVDYVTGPPFLDPATLRHRALAAGVQPDPVKAIVDFRDQLAARGIDLIAVPSR